MVKRGASRHRGRSRARRDGSDDTESKVAAKTGAMKFAPIVPGKENHAFSTVKDLILRKLQKESVDNCDVVTSLRAMVLTDLAPFRPRLRMADDADLAERAIMQSSYADEQKEAIKVHAERIRKQELNMKRAFATICDEYCTKGMRQRIETHPDYHTRIQDNPIVLLQEIQKLMHETVRAQYSMLTHVEAIEALVTMKQNDGEELLDYVKRFKQLRTTYKSYLGTSLFNAHVEGLPAYATAADDAARAAMKTDMFEAFSALLILRGADKKEFSKLTEQLNMQMSMGIDQYPKTMVKAVDILANHQTANQTANGYKKENNKARDKSKGPKQVSKMSEKLTESSFAQRGKQTSQWPCNCCGEMGHKAIDCPKYATTLPNQWVMPPGSYGKKSSFGGK